MYLVDGGAESVAGGGVVRVIGKYSDETYRARKSFV